MLRPSPGSVKPRAMAPGRVAVWAALPAPPCEWHEVCPDCPRRPEEETMFSIETAMAAALMAADYWVWSYAIASWLP